MLTDIIGSTVVLLVFFLVSLGFTGFYWVFNEFTEFYRVFNDFYLVSIGSKYFFLGFKWLHQKVL